MSDELFRITEERNRAGIFIISPSFRRQGEISMSGKYCHQIGGKESQMCRAVEYVSTSGGEGDMAQY